jgi:hypothetical protein
MMILFLVVKYLSLLFGRKNNFFQSNFFSVVFQFFFCNLSSIMFLAFQELSTINNKNENLIKTTTKARKVKNTDHEVFFFFSGFCCA